MAKPICVCYFNPDLPFRKGGRDTNVSEMNDMIEKRFPDYHTIALPSFRSMDGEVEEIRFEVFNADKVDEISFNQFKEEILKTLLVT